MIWQSVNFDVFIKNLLRLWYEKILLLTSVNLWGDYRRTLRFFLLSRHCSSNFEKGITLVGTLLISGTVSSRFVKSTSLGKSVYMSLWKCSISSGGASNMFE
ncbi:hypothetical protein EGX57_01825 [Vibrio cholerae]|nr:hypothetical protein [Vibrio cholerae]EGR0940027.1 hypothetical protein [Vibrio cholerae]KAA1226222.1 hypothetical protein F0Q18_09950 [Vibrio cholerae]